MSGFTVSKVICAQMSVRPVKVILRPTASTRGATNELNLCVKNMRYGRERAPIRTILLTLLEASHPPLRIRAEPTTRHSKAVLLCDMCNSQMDIDSNTRRSQGMRLHRNFVGRVSR